MEDGREIEYFECEECSFETRHKKHQKRHNQQYMKQKKTSNLQNMTTDVTEWIIYNAISKPSTKKTPRQRIHVISVISRANMRII